MMRKIFFICGILLLTSCATRKKVTAKNIPAATSENTTKVVPTSEVAATTIQLATSIGSRLLEACNTSKFKPFTKEEATEKVIQNMDPKKLSETCKKINFRNGKFLGLDLQQITYNAATASYQFNYVIIYEKKMFPRELYVTINAENKVSAIQTKEQKVKPL